MHFTSSEEADILGRSGLQLSQEVWLAIQDRYNEPARHYHDWNHALSVLSWVNHVCENVLPSCPVTQRELTELRLAAIFHDVIYETQGSPHNEEASVRALCSYLPDHYPLTTALIMATAKHGKLESSDVPFITALFLDCDIASFGEMRWEVVVWNDQNVVKELLQRYSPEQVAVGRKAFLGGLLNKKSIFLSDYFKNRFEVQARSNIQKLIEQLG